MPERQDDSQPIDPTTAPPSSGPRRATGNGLLARLLRRLGAVPLLVARAVSFRDKRGFSNRLANTYQTNRINLFLAFSRTHGPWRLRWMALRGVLEYLRNTALYNAPKLWRGFDVYNPEALERSLEMQSGLVVAGQHMGPQRYSFTEVSARVGQLKVAMTEQFTDQAQDWFDRVIGDLGSGSQVDAVRALQVLAVEEPTCALKMVRALKAGGAVMFDLDGNIGVGGEERTLVEGTTQLDFFGRRVHVRGGVAYLAHRTGAPILPLISVWGQKGRPELHYFDPIVPAEGESRQDFERRALVQLYGQLEAVIRRYPTQWEMWPHFYKWLASPPKLDDAARERLGRAADAFEARLADGDLPLHVDRSDAAVLRMRGHELFVDAKGFRFFLASPLCGRVLRELHRGTHLKRLVERLGRRGHEPRQIFAELARLQILGLLEERSAPPVLSPRPRSRARG